MSIFCCAQHHRSEDSDYVGLEIGKDGKERCTEGHEDHLDEWYADSGFESGVLYAADVDYVRAMNAVDRRSEP